jgi:hypothetical protein
MNVLFKNIPVGIRDFELVAFINSTFNVDRIAEKGLSLSVDGVTMLEIQDNFTRPIEQFGIVRISSPDVAKEVIEQLNGCVVNQYQITTREYHTRSASNDPRINSHNSQNNFTEKRKGERRKSTLVFSRRV